MKLSQTAPGVFAVEFESEEELRAEARTHLSAGGLLLRPADRLPMFTRVTVALRLRGRGEAKVGAVVVGVLADGLALQIEGRPDAVLAALRNSVDKAADKTADKTADEAADQTTGEAAEEEEGAERGAGQAETTTLWERLRGMTPPQKILLAPKADRITRALLVQESDAQVLFALLKNPRLSIDEVVRVAKSSYLSFQAAELILRTSTWAANLDVRVALIRNPKLPVPMALRILPTLPDSEVRAIAKGAATSMPLKQAALKRLQGG